METQPLFAVSGLDYAQKVKGLNSVSYDQGVVYERDFRLQGWIGSVMQFIAENPEIEHFQFNGDQKFSELTGVVVVSYNAEGSCVIEDVFDSYCVSRDDPLFHIVDLVPKNKNFVGGLLELQLSRHNFEKKIKLLLNEHNMSTASWHLSWEEFLTQVRASYK